MHLTQRFDQESVLLLFNLVCRCIVYHNSCYSLMNNRTWKPGDANDLNEQKNSSVTYGNGFTVHNEYDDFNRVTGIVYGAETEPRYEFRYNARGQTAWMKDSLLDRITETEYDLSDRPRRIKTHENGQHLYTGEVTYDALYGHLSTFTERVRTHGTVLCAKAIA